MTGLNFSPLEDRGDIFSDELTEERVVRITHAFVRYLHDVSTSGHSIKIAIGYDGRIRSRDFAAVAAEIISKNGIEVLLSSAVVPVPALSFATRHHRCTAGIMMTGGFAPPDAVRIEFKGGNGAPFSSGEMKRISTISSEFDRRPNDLSVDLSGEIFTIEFLPDYKSYLRTIIDLPALTSFGQNPKNNANVMIDSMGGAGQTIIEEILVSCGWRAQTLFSAPEARFFDRCPKPIAENLQALKYNVTVVDAQMGIATDGDAGTCGIMLDNGNCLDIQEMTLALLWHAIKQKRWTGNFVKPPFVTDRVKRFSKREGVSVTESDLEGGFGDISKSDWIVGVSGRGEIGFGSCLPERDGILAGLLFAEMAAVSEKPLRQIVELVEDEMGKGFYQSVEVKGGTLEGRTLQSRLRSLMSSIHPGEDFAHQQVFEHSGIADGMKLQWGYCRWLLAELEDGGNAIRIHSEALTGEELASTLNRAAEILQT